MAKRLTGSECRPFGVVSGVGRLMGVLDRVEIVEGKETGLGMNMGRDM